MTEVAFHFNAPDPVAYACRLLRKAVSNGARMVVLGVPDTVNSPSFALVNEYRTAAGTPVYHFDFYRIKNIAEAVDMGAEEYFYTPDALCLIEWPERIEPMLPPETHLITMETLPSGERKIKVRR